MTATNATTIILMLLSVSCISLKDKSLPQPQKEKKFAIYQTAQATDHRLSPIGSVTLQPFGQPLETQACIFIDPDKTFQTIVGIGGALTDAAAEVFFSLTAEKQEELLNAYFDPEKGIGYTLARTNIQSCDFSSSSYSYVQTGDVELKSFSIEPDKRYRIPFIKKAMNRAKQGLKIFASPWSPPGWMKTNNDMLHGGKLKPEYYSVWAQCFVRFIRAYQAEGVPIWGITVQNEPMATQRWESCIYTAEEERDFVRDHLGPALRKAKLEEVKIMVWDHNRDLIYQRVSTILDDPRAAQYVWGIGFHWYMQDAFENIKRVHEVYPQYQLLFTEGCGYPFNDAEMRSWHWGERYATSMIHDFNNGAVGWTDWNVLLDEKGGPNHVGNYCLAPVHKLADGSLYYMNSFYYLGHFSKFVRPGAKRIISSSNRDKLLTTAFINPDGRIAVIVLNTSDEAFDYRLWWKGDAALLHSKPHSIMTLISER